MKKLFKIFKLIICIGLIFVIFVLCFFYVSYPKKYAKQVEEYCAVYGVENSLIYAVIRSESSFGSNKISPKGATGLMQIMPKTAEFIAGKLGIKEYDLKNTSDNINFGVWYLSYLLKKFDSEKLAIFAYNAGEGAVQEWLKVESIDNFPYKETREYYLKVKRAKNIYKKLYKI